MCDRKNCSSDTLVNELASRTMNIPPSGDGCDSLTGVGGGVRSGGGGGGNGGGGNGGGGNHGGSLDTVHNSSVVTEGVDSASVGKVGNNVVNDIVIKGDISTKDKVVPTVGAVTARWIPNPLFPRLVPLFQHLSSFTRKADIASNGMVEGRLLANDSSIKPLIGIIVKEWCDWVPALDFVPLSPLWIWVLDLR